MAVTNAQASPKPSKGSQETRLNDDVSMPGFVAPGDGPYDTTDPTERATSVSPDKATAALKGFGVVNAVVPLPPLPVQERDKSQDRIETYEVPGPDGKPVTVTHNIDSGETSVS
jgi:hypothetical protein